MISSGNDCNNLSINMNHQIELSSKLKENNNMNSVAEQFRVVEGDSKSNFNRFLNRNQEINYNSMLKKSEKRRSIHKVFSIQPGIDHEKQLRSMATSTLLFNQKLQVIARLQPEENPSIKVESCLFKLNKTELQIIAPDERRMLEEMDGFQKRERIRHSPPGGNSPSQKEENAHLFQSPISKINYEMEREEERAAYSSEKKEKKANTFKFDHVFPENVNDPEIWESLSNLYSNCLKTSRNLVIVNLNNNNQFSSQHSLISQITRTLPSLIAHVHQKATFFLSSFEISQSSQHPLVLLDSTQINNNNHGQLFSQLSQKLNSLPKRTGAQCFVYSFQLKEEGKLISELIFIDIPQFLEKGQSVVSSSLGRFNSYCRDLAGLLSFQGGAIHQNDVFLSTLLQKFRLGDEMAVIANFKISLSYLSSNYSLLRFSQILFKSKHYLDSMFLSFCLQQQTLLGTLPNSSLSLKDELQLLSTKNYAFKEQIKTLVSDLSAREEEILQLREANDAFQQKNDSLEKTNQKQKLLILEQNNQLASLKQKIESSEQRIEELKRSFGVLDNFDKSLLGDSKNKSMILLSKKKGQHFFETADKLVQTEEFKEIKDESKTNNRNRKNEVESDDENGETPQKYLQQLDDILQNFDSKRSMSSYFSPRNLSLANLALIENEGFKQKLIIKEQEISKIKSIIVAQTENYQILSNHSTEIEKQNQENLKLIVRLSVIFEDKLAENSEILKQTLDFYEGEIAGMRELLKFGLKALSSELEGLKGDIESAHHEKQQWVSIFTRKTEEIYRQMSNKLEQKNQRIKQYEEVLQKFGTLTLTK